MLTAPTVQDLDDHALLRERQAELGQFLTPRHVADFMVGCSGSLPGHIRFLDAGAGSGALTAAVVRYSIQANPRPTRLSVVAYELDGKVIPLLRQTMLDCQKACLENGIDFDAKIRNEDFIASVVPTLRLDLFAPEPTRFNLAVVNPPYRKIRADSDTRLLLRSIGVETSNLYAAFLSVITRLLAPGGTLVSITPRSFCNGPYFRPFRADFLRSMSLRRLHVFESRSKAFKADEVLQETVIVHAIKEASQPPTMQISSSSGEPGAIVTSRHVPARQVVAPGDPEQFIHFPAEGRISDAGSKIGNLTSSLGDLGLEVSTGRVVDFRAQAFLRKEPASNTVPLIYPCHFDGGFVRWPRQDSRKPNAIVDEAGTRNLLISSGIYVLVKRFTSKEERRRIVACVLDPNLVPGERLGFENHLNYFHSSGRALPRNLAVGLAAFLNSERTDCWFRQFNGHTQVNATDLRSLRYPGRTQLERLGRLLEHSDLTLEQRNQAIEEELFK